MSKLLKNFAKDECGAVTVDWVLLTSTLVILGFLMMSIIGGAAQDHGNWLEDTMLDKVTD